MKSLLQRPNTIVAGDIFASCSGAFLYWRTAVQSNIIEVLYNVTNDSLNRPTWHCMQLKPLHVLTKFHVPVFPPKDAGRKHKVSCSLQHSMRIAIPGSPTNSCGIEKQTGCSFCCYCVIFPWAFTVCFVICITLQRSTQSRRERCNDFPGGI